MIWRIFLPTWTSVSTGSSIVRARMLSAYPCRETFETAKAAVVRGSEERALQQHTRTTPRTVSTPATDSGVQEGTTDVSVF